MKICCSFGVGEGGNDHSVCICIFVKISFKRKKTDLQPVSRPVERVHYLGGEVGVQSPFHAIAV